MIYFKTFKNKNKFPLEAGTRVPRYTKKLGEHGTFLFAKNHCPLCRQVLLFKNLFAYQW